VFQYGEQLLVSKSLSNQKYRLFAMRLQIIRHGLPTSRRGGRAVVLISKTDGQSRHLRFRCPARAAQPLPPSPQAQASSPAQSDY